MPEKTNPETHIHKCIPPLVKITISDHADSLTQLRLDSLGDQDHQVDQLPLDGRNLFKGELVVAFFINIVVLDEVLKV